MSDALAVLGKHVNRQLTERARPLYLVVDGHFQLIAKRGNARHYGLRDLHAGAPMLDRLPVLSGMRPDIDTQMWRFVALPDAPVCDVHALRHADGWGIALLDASTEHAEQQVRQQTAHELLLAQRERERLLVELERANELKASFITRMSHEFRTPLTAVIGYGEQLHELCGADDERRQHAATVVRGGRYLLNLVENLLDQARIDGDNLTLNRGACDLHELSDDVERLLRPLADRKQLSFSWWFDGGIPTRVWLDGLRLEQVLINLVGNAIKFTREGGINVEFDWHAGRLEVAISDTGPGIDAEHVDAVFEPFRQVSEDVTAGAGLGLTISRAIVRAMGGDISLQANDQQGCRFTFSVNAEAVRTGGSQSSDALAGKHILLIDDDPDLLNLFSLYLKAAGCSVTTVDDASLAAQRVRDVKPDLVVLDLNLGGANGNALARELRKAGYRRPLALLSASTDDVPTDTVIDARWQKPISRAQLLDNAATLLS